MTNRKSTKRALLGSVMAMVLCLAMLVGATFAWFTDTASTGVNKIQAGNLDIEIQDENGKPVTNLSWVKAEGAEGEQVLWEPGCTYELPPFQIVNKGNLALKYKIVVTGLEGDSGLLKVITFTYKTADGATFDINQEGHLTAKGTDKASTGLITLTGTMDTAAGNDYMGKELKNITITVVATQDTVESDSFNNRYDNAAEYPEKVPTTVTVATAEELKAALTTLTDAGSGDNKVIINGDITLAEGETWTPVTVDGYRGAGVITVEGNGHTISGLNNALFAGGFAGTSGIVIKDLTLDKMTINDSTNTQGIGAFICNVDSMPKIDLVNCHLTNSTITSTAGARVGGLVGWSSGYNKPNDGPVDTYVTITNCSVDNCEITAKGSVGGIIGHAGANPATYHSITDCTVTNTKLHSTDDGGWRVGVVVGTANVGQMFTKDIYFWGRPSSAGDGYDATSSAGSNKGPTNQEYLDEVKARIDTFLVHHPYLDRADVPAEMVTASASGLDPDITPQCAYVQVKRVAQARGLTEEQVRAIVDKSIEKPFLGLLGTEKVNVLKLNIALEESNK